MVKAQEAEFGVNFTNPDLEAGPTNPLALKRTFGSTEPIRVKLYRDHAAVSASRRVVSQVLDWQLADRMVTPSCAAALPRGGGRCRLPRPKGVGAPVRAATALAFQPIKLYHTWLGRKSAGCSALPSSLPGLHPIKEDRRGVLRWSFSIGSNITQTVICRWLHAIVMQPWPCDPDPAACGVCPLLAVVPLLSESVAAGGLCLGYLVA